MKKLFLCSSFTDVADLFAESEKDLAGKNVAFIPTASEVEKVTYYVGEGKKALEKLGLIVDTLDLKQPAADIEAKLLHNDFIYVTGGNTFYLLQELKKSGADNIIIEQVNAGKLYIGESAGAIAASTNIEYSSAMDNPEKAPDLTEYNALGLVDFYTIPHFGEEPFKKTAQKIVDDYSRQIPIKVISNKDAIRVDGEQIKIINA